MKFHWSSREPRVSGTAAGTVRHSRIMPGCGSCQNLLPSTTRRRLTSNFRVFPRGPCSDVSCTAARRSTSRSAASASRGTRMARQWRLSAAGIRSSRKCRATRFAGRLAPSGYAPVIIGGVPEPIRLMIFRCAATAHAILSGSGTGASIGIVITSGHGTFAVSTRRGEYHAVSTAPRRGTGDRDFSSFLHLSCAARGTVLVASRYAADSSSARPGTGRSTAIPPAVNNPAPGSRS